MGTEKLGKVNEAGAVGSRDPASLPLAPPVPVIPGNAVGKVRLSVSPTPNVGTAALGMSTAAILLGSTTRSVDWV